MIILCRHRQLSYSVGSEKELQSFVQDSNILLSQVKLNLREWKFFGVNYEPNMPTSVLGLMWDTNKYDLFCDIEKITVREPVTRVGQKYYTPIKSILYYFMRGKIVSLRF